MILCLALLPQVLNVLLQYSNLIRVLLLQFLNLGLLFFSQSFDFSFGVSNLCRGSLLNLIRSLLDSSDLEISSALYFTQRGLEAVGIFRLDPADESNHAFVSLKILACAFVFTTFADDLGLGALVHNMRQVSIHFLVKLAVTAVVDAGSLLNRTLASVLKSLVEWVLLIAVF